MEVDLKHENLRLEAMKYIKKIYKCLICNNSEFNFESDVVKHIEERHLDIILSPQIKKEFSKNCKETKEVNQMKNDFKSIILPSKVTGSSTF